MKKNELIDQDKVISSWEEIQYCKPKKIKNHTLNNIVNFQIIWEWWNRKVKSWLLISTHELNIFSLIFSWFFGAFLLAFHMCFVLFYNLWRKLAFMVKERGNKAREWSQKLSSMQVSTIAFHGSAMALQISIQTV